MAKILITNGIIVPMDGKNHTIEKKALLIEDDRISAIDDPEVLMKTPGIEKTIDAGNMAVMPGMIDGHTHSALTCLLRGIAEDLSMEEYDNKWIVPLSEKVFTDEDVYPLARLSSLEMLKFGITCCNELGIQTQDGSMMEGTALAFEESGIRGILAPDVSDVDVYSEEMLSVWDPSEIPALRSEKRKKQKIDEAVRLLKKWHLNDDNIITCRFAHDMPVLCDPEVLKETKALADEYGIGINAHVHTNEIEDFGMVQMYQKTSAEFLDEIGYLDKNTALVHMRTELSDQAIKTIKASGAPVIICPLIAAKEQMLVQAGRMYEAGVNLSIGSDGLMLDPFDQIRHAVVASRLSGGWPKLMNAYNFLEMATIKGAQALGRDDQIGSLEVGKQADLILVDFDKPHMVPMNRHYDIVTNLVHYAHGSDVHTVLVAGRVVVENGEAKTLDEAQVIEEVNRRTEAIIDKKMQLPND